MATKAVFFSDKRQSADLVVFGVFEGTKTVKEVKILEPAAQEVLSYAQKTKRFEGKAGQSLSFYDQSHNEAPEVLMLGLGAKKSFSGSSFKQIVGRVMQIAKASKFKKVRLVLETFVSSSLSLADAAGVASEVKTLSLYSFDHYKRQGKLKAKPIDLELLLSKRSQAASVQKSAQSRQAVAEGTLLARNLINEPANIMNAQQMASIAKKMAAKKKLSCQVIGQAEIKRMKMGGILGVNQGATTPPALIVLEHGKKYKSKGTVCLVGKGVTFDTGGISIKPAKSMEKMKYDMSGAAAMIGTMSAVADLKLPLHVVSLTPCVENNVAEDPIRPGDIITMYNKKTVEVINTDAEGRLILADALAYAAKYKPKAIIDAATLTGMAAYTFGNLCCAVMGNNEKLLNKVKAAGDKVGERCWELPMYKEYSQQIKGNHSDLQNIGGPFGGTITAAKFLEEFVPAKTPWVHIDIAGVAWCDSPRADCPVGGTGFGVSLLSQFLSQYR